MIGQVLFPERKKLAAAKELPGFVSIHAIDEMETHKWIGYDRPEIGQERLTVRQAGGFNEFSENPDFAAGFSLTFHAAFDNLHPSHGCDALRANSRLPFMEGTS